MYGLQAINAANGWAVTIAGVSIVFTGLLVLAAVMGNMERFLALWDRKGEFFRPGKGKLEAQPVRQAAAPGEPIKPAAAETAAVALASEQIEAANAFQLITNRLGEPFSLPQLLEKAAVHGISHPHRHLESFLKLRLIVESEGDQPGLYQWRKDVRIVGTEAEVS